MPKPTNNTPKPKRDAKGKGTKAKDAKPKAGRYTHAELQEFARLCYELGNQTRAFLAIRPAALEWDSAHVTTEASRLAKSPKVAPILEAIKKEARELAEKKTKVTIVGQAELLATYSEMFWDCIETRKRKNQATGVKYEGPDHDNIQRYGKELSKLQGLDKLNLNVKAEGGVLAIPVAPMMKPEDWHDAAKQMIQGGEGA